MNGAIANITAALRAPMGDENMRGRKFIVLAGTARSPFLEVTALLRPLPVTLARPM